MTATSFWMILSKHDTEETEIFLSPSIPLTRDRNTTWQRLQRKQV
ncbi:MAG: hypothetical protein AAGA75_26785 [Cyanobacteria bacterium P01_E01_bin.6]